MAFGQLEFPSIWPSMNICMWERLNGIYMEQLVVCINLDRYDFHVDSVQLVQLGHFTYMLSEHAAFAGLSIRNPSSS